MTVVARFEIRYTRFLDSEGKPLGELPGFAQEREALVALYRAMVLTRTFDSKAIALQRTGRLGTYASSLGQEAIAVGTGAAMAPDDVLAPSFREHGAQLLRGVTATELFLYWGGDERGSDFQADSARHDFPVSIPVGSHAPYAAGAATAFRLRGEARAVACVFGDGATSKGDVYEAMNLAGAWRLPVVFVVNNNQWAISVPRAAQTAAETLAQKAIACGFSGEQVDGNDVIAVRHAVGAALDRARDGGGPHMVECLSYRLGDHTTADDASRYRDDATVSPHWKEDPVTRLRAHLTAAHGWAKDEEEALIDACADEVEKAADEYLATAPQPVEAVFDHTYAELPADLTPQRDAAVRIATGGEEDGDG
jgi:pyruvate dehydrogenase E1 component alpha subunit